MAIPATFQEFLNNRDAYVVRHYNVVQDDGKYRDSHIGGTSVLAACETQDVVFEYVVLQDWCAQFGERYETVLELLDALMLRWTKRHNVTGIDKFAPLYWTKDAITIAFYDGDVTFNDIVLVTKDVAYDLAIRLQHIQKH